MSSLLAAHHDLHILLTAAKHTHNALRAALLAAAPRRPKKPTFKFVGADPDLLPPAAVRELLADYHRLAARVEALEKQVATSKAR